jgi:DNA-binding PadR family transcriptional regulator
MVRVSLRYGLLGLLAEGPASGYDLTRRFERVLGAVWPAKHPSIYTELRRLVEDGFIEVHAEGPRRRTSYRLTEPGLAALRAWLAEIPVDHTLRLEPVLRSFFFWLMDADTLAEHLSAEAAFYQGQVARYRALADAKDRGDLGSGPRTQSLRIALEAGIRVFEALASWADWAQERGVAPPGEGASATAERPLSPPASP